MQYVARIRCEELVRHIKLFAWQVEFEAASPGDEIVDARMGRDGFVELLVQNHKPGEADGFDSSYYLMPSWNRLNV